jgi:hypothetical protein
VVVLSSYDPEIIKGGFEAGLGVIWPIVVHVQVEIINC